MYVEHPLKAQELYKGAVIRERSETGRKLGDYKVVEEPTGCTAKGHVHVAVQKVGSDGSDVDKVARTWCYYGGTTIQILV